MIATVSDLGKAKRVFAVYAPRVTAYELDVRDRQGMRRLLEHERPDEIYNLASWSSVGLSWSHPWQVTEINGLAVLGLLEEVLSLNRSDGYSPRICQASSSEMFGLVRELPQNEDSPHHPRSPYATAKSFAHHTAVNYRESYGLFVATAILFNHESPLRPATFVTRKITAGVAAIALGRQKRSPSAARTSVETGAQRWTMSRRCAGPYSVTNRPTTASLRGSHTRWGSSFQKRSARRVSRRHGARDP